MNDLTDKLSAWLNDAAEKPVIWGKSDCTAWVASWVMEARGIDLCLPPYATRHEAMRIIAKSGSLANLWEETLAPHGILEAFDPQPGDIAVIAAAAATEVGGIFLPGGYFALRAEPVGFSILRPRKVIRSWSLSV